MQWGLARLMLQAGRMDALRTELERNDQAAELRRLAGGLAALGAVAAVRDSVEMSFSGRESQASELIRLARLVRETQTMVKGVAA